MDSNNDFLEFDRSQLGQQLQMRQTPTKSQEYEVQNSRLFHRYETETTWQAFDYDICTSNLREIIDPKRTNQESSSQCFITETQDELKQTFSEDGFRVLKRRPVSNRLETVPYPSAFTPGEIVFPLERKGSLKRTNSQASLQCENGIVQLSGKSLDAPLRYRIPDKRGENNAFRVLADERPVAAKEAWRSDRQ